MKIAVEGCAHGELNKIYECLEHIELRESIKIDLLICCGDFQSVRDRIDMNSMAVPDKYMQMKDFWEYYNGKRVAPILTIFIGGNHEASSYLWELPYGGWVAENIYYLGYSGVVNFAGIRIGGMSGIFKKRDYYKDHFEVPPFNNDTKRSFYHVRRRDVEKMKLLKTNPPDIVLSHDWPANIYNHGDKEQLMRFKPFLREDIESNTLGNEGAEEVLHHLQPSYWFSGHMHAKFAAVVEHPNGCRTKFLALDKCLPKRKFLQILDMGEGKDEGFLKYDLYWLGILRTTNGLTRFMELSEEHTPNKDILDDIQRCCSNFDVIPFSKSINGQNSQTREFCERFGLKNPCITQTWKSIKQTSKCDDIVTDNDTEQTDTSKCGTTPMTQMSLPKCSNITPKPKMVLPKPGTGDTTIKSNKSLMLDNRDDDEFGEITNPSSLTFDVKDSSSGSSNEDSSSGSSSSSNSDDDDSSDDDNITIKSKTKVREPPSFIETPVTAKTPISKYATAPYPSASTPLKWEEDGSELENKELSFAETPFKGPVADVTTDSSLATYKPEDSKVTCNNASDTSDIGSDVSLKEGGETEMIQTPIKKFKLIRRNQSIYTPTKEED